MKTELLMLLLEAMVVYCIVLWAHSLRHRYGLTHFYALLGGITAIMSWVTDAGIAVQVAQITFMIGSSVFYTSLLLGVFVLYVFDGPPAARSAISTIIGISILTPLAAEILLYQAELYTNMHVAFLPNPSLRINLASVSASLIDMVFLAIAWEYLGKPNFQMKLWMRTFITLLGVMGLDVVLFTTGAFAGEANYLNIFIGTLLSRFCISGLAFIFLYAYLHHQNKRPEVHMINRPLLAILKEVAVIQLELSHTQQEVERRKKVEKELESVIQELKQTLSEIKVLRGLLPICCICKKIRDDQGYWNQIETYISSHSAVEFTHGICPDCLEIHYPHAK